MKKFWKKTEGFTLVELVVVIAILGILAGVGTVGYSGYIKRANMAADQQLVSQVKNALELATYTSTTPLEGYVSLSTDADDTVYSGTGIEEAVEAAFGADPVLELKHDGWTGANATADVLANFSNWGSDERTAALAALVSGDDTQVTPSFVNEIDELFGLIESTATGIGSSLGKSGAALLKSAAGLTADSITAAKFAEDWTAGKWENGLMGTGESYNGSAVENGSSDADFMANAIANAAVIKARNTSFAAYLRTNEVDPDLCAIIENLTYEGTGVPVDMFSSDSTAIFNSKVEAGITNGDFDRNAVNSIRTLSGSYFNGGTSSQAYKDGLAYYAMMDTVTSVSGDDLDDDTYWDSMKDAVSTYGKIARKELTLSDLSAVQSGGVVVSVKDGKVTVSPGTILEG